MKSIRSRNAYIVSLKNRQGKRYAKSLPKHEKFSKTESSFELHHFIKGGTAEKVAFMQGRGQKIKITR